MKDRPNRIKKGNILIKLDDTELHIMIDDILNIKKGGYNLTSFTFVGWVWNEDMHQISLADIENNNIPLYTDFEFTTDLVLRDYQEAPAFYIDWLGDKNKGMNFGKFTLYLY